MPNPKLTKDALQQAVDSFVQYGTDIAAATALGMSRTTFQHRRREARRLGYTPSRLVKPKAKEPEVVDVKVALRKLLRTPKTGDALAQALNVSIFEVFQALDDLEKDGINLERNNETWSVVKGVPASWTGEKTFELVSRPDNTFLFGACGDQHVASKYHREDVSRDLYRRYADNGVQAVFNTGNWIDGEASFNRYDIVAYGIDAQARLLADTYPKADFPTYAVWGDDHEGWYAQRDGIDVGRYVEGIMRSADHQWTDLGFMEAHVRLVNVNTGKSVVMAVVHPGGGSAYATSYRPQKIIESFEGGEKPAVALFGHYHKLDPGLVRNVWYLQTGCCQDQTPFMRKKSIEAHVGGAMVKLEQDPATGGITGFTPSLWRYFNHAYHVENGFANGRWSKHGRVRPIPRGITP